MIERGWNSAKALLDGFQAGHPDWAVRLLATVVIVAAAYGIGHLIRVIVGSRLTRLLARTGANWDDTFLNEITRRIPFWSLLAGIAFALPQWPLDPRNAERALNVLSALGVASVTFALAAVSTRLVATYGPRVSPSMPVTGLTQNIVRITVIVLGALVIIRSLGYPIEGVIATLGIGGLAVALAVQEPLSNLFAGLFITLAGQVRIGDYVKLDSGAEGYVVDFNWRSARMRQLGDNIIIVPNAKLSQAVVTNYSLPAAELSVSVEFTVDRSANLAAVERIATEVGQAVMKDVAGGVPTADVSVRFQSFADTGIRASIGLRVRHFVDQFLVRHEVIKRLQARLTQENIRFR